MDGILHRQKCGEFQAMAHDCSPESGLISVVQCRCQKDAANRAESSLLDYTSGEQKAAIPIQRCDHILLPALLH